MALNYSDLDPTRTNARNGNESLPLELIIEQFTGMVHGTIERRSVLSPWVPMQKVTGTSTFRNDAVGESVLQKVVPGEPPAGNKSDFAKHTVTIDTLINAREIFALLDTFQSNWDRRRKVATEQGKKHAKFLDQALMIAGLKAAMSTASAYSTTGSDGKPAGHGTGNIKTLASTGDALDPAALYQGFADLFVKMENQDVIPREDDVAIIVPPAQFYALSQAEQLINGMYVTAAGTKIDNTMLLKTYGVPVFSSNNLPQTNITNHLLSNTDNGNFYNGDFTKVVALALSASAIMAGETIPLTGDVFYDKISKCWFVDSHTSFAAGIDRVEYAGVILKP